MKARTLLKMAEVVNLGLPVYPNKLMYRGGESVCALGFNGDVSKWGSITKRNASQGENAPRKELYALAR